MDETKASGKRFDVAIVGMSGRFPGAKTIHEYWKNLIRGTESIRIFNDEELDRRGVPASRLHQPNFVKAGSVLEEIDQFAASFFGYSPREAELMDPQHRFFLESAWEALEDAGYAPRHAKGNVGVYAASSLSSYLLFNVLRSPKFHHQDDAFQAMIGTDKDFLATCVSYKLNLTGPSITIQTGCSSSLVAICMAVQSLLTYQCDMAIAGGVSISVPQRTGYDYQPGGIASPDGHCRPFSARAAGTVFGDGVGVIILMRLEDALADRCNIYAVVRGTAINNDGSAKVGYTAPSVQGQTEVILRAQALAEITAEEIGYVEAHGTATALGDPAEIAALTTAFHLSTHKNGFCALGSVKSNLGHLDAAAGVAGVIKTALMLKHQKLVPSLYYDDPNPAIDFATTPFYVNTRFCDWDSSGGSRCAGVSSFGIGGTNAHIILEQAPGVVSESNSSFQLLTVSADSRHALEDNMSSLARFLRETPSANLADVAYTLHVGRETFRHRSALVCQGIQEAARSLETQTKDSLHSAYTETSGRGVVFMFPGGGAQSAGMGRELYQSQIVFRQAIDRCADLLNPHLGYDLRLLMYASGESTEAAAAQLALPSAGLPAIFSTEYALAQLFMFWGLQPQSLIGHSLGECTAAYLAGVFCLEDALAFVVLRGKLLETVSAGAMLSVYLPEKDILELELSGISIAAVNGPDHCVISGAKTAIDETTRLLESREIEYRRLHIEAASHSMHIFPIVNSLRKFLTGIKLNAPKIPLISNLTGTWAQGDQITNPEYWVKHLLHTVRFADGLNELSKLSNIALLEVGPGNSLSTFARAQLQGQEAVPVISSMRHPHETFPEASILYAAMGKLWLAGVEIDWDSFHADDHCRRISLPTYQFERHRYWLEPATGPEVADSGSSEKKSNLDEWFYLPSWKCGLPLSVDYVLHHDRESLWLVLSDNYGIGDALLDVLRRAGLCAFIAKSENGFRELDNGHYCVDPCVTSDYVKLLESINAGSVSRLKIVHVWSCLPVGEEQDFSQAQRLGIFSVLALARGLVQQAVPTDLLLVSNRVAQITGAEPVDLAKSPLRAAAIVLSQELEYVQSKLLDVDLKDLTHEAIDYITSQIISESGFQDSHRFVVRRAKQMWKQAYEPVSLVNKEGNTLRQNAVYLLVGGLGNVGLTLAEAFSNIVPCKLILTGRSEFPDRTAWCSLPDSELKRKTEILTSIEQSGSQVAVFTVDVADESAMQQMLEEVEGKYGPVCGVVHLAGITGDQALRLIPDLDESECELQFHSKVKGCCTLAKILSGRPLDFCVLFSSNASVLGGIGMLAYAAANSFMDVFANQAPLSGQRWISINWDGWLTSNSSLLRKGKTVLDRHAMKSHEGVTALMRILANGIAGQIVVSTGDLALRVEEWARKQGLAEESKARLESHSGRSVSTEYLAPNTTLEKELALVWSEVLGLKTVGLHDNLFELGGNSLIGLRIIAKLKRKLGIEVPVTALFEGPTVHTLAQLIASNDSPSRTSHLYVDEIEKGKFRRKKPVTLPAVVSETVETPIGLPQPNGRVSPNEVSDGAALSRGVDANAIAIIGMSGAFPGAANPQELWEQLRQGRELVRLLPTNAQFVSTNNHSASSRFVRAVAAMDGFDLLDADFFGMTPAEAQLTDPQHRILLEHSWNALEDAGYCTKEHKESVAVYAGATINTYLICNLLSNPEVMRTVDPIQINVANGSDFLATRISYKLNLTGPSHTIQSACSTSLVAIHAACRSLLDKGCDLALAGGVSVNVSLLDGYRYVEGGIVSPDGHCRAFDAKAEGTIFGSGVGVVVLRRLEDALVHGDHIHAVIKGSAINNDGSLKAGYTAPNVEGQARVIAEALGASAVDPETITYVECHGTGTALGDPIEMRALSNAFRGRTTRSGYCAVGSVKTNLGHLDAAAGVTGLIKVIQSMKHRQLPPSLHFEQPNPQIEFTGSPFYVNTELREWKPDGGRLRAGVSAFGVGGTNAHVIVEEAPKRRESGESREWQLLLLSARTQTSLAAAGRNLARHVREKKEKLSDVAYTLAVGRQRFGWRRALVCRQGEAGKAAEALEAGLADAYSKADEEEPAVVMVFPGEGAQPAEMGSELYRSEEVFRQEMDKCAEMLKPELGLDLREALYGGKRKEELHETWLTQPVLFATEYALARLWESWGVKPVGMLGDSLGEYLAATFSGVFKLEDGLKLVMLRGRLMQEMPRGAMLAVEINEKEVKDWVEEGVWLAAVHGPQMCTVGGTEKVMTRLEQKLRKTGRGVQRLRTSHAFHTGLMEGMINSYVEEVRKVEIGEIKIPFISNVTGTWAEQKQVEDAKYWGRQLRETVQCERGIEELMGSQQPVALVVGSDQWLKRLGQHRGPATRFLSSLAGSTQLEQEAMLKAVGGLWAAGVKIDWHVYYGREQRHRVSLPTYPFERNRHWIDPPTEIRPMGSTEELAQLYPRDLRAESVSRQPQVVGNRPLLRNHYVPPRNDLEATIVKILEAGLGVHPIGVTDKFGELGGDSLTAVGMVDQINARLDCRIRVVDLFEDLTIRELASTISGTNVPDEVGKDSDNGREKDERRANIREARRGRKLAGSP